MRGETTEGEPMTTETTRRLTLERRQEIEEYLALGHDNWQWRDLPFEVEAGWATTRELLDEIDALIARAAAAERVVSAARQFSLIVATPRFHDERGALTTLDAALAAYDATHTDPATP